MRVAYTDPAWAVNGDRTVDVSLATVEREVYGDDVDIDLGVFTDERFVTEGPRLWEYLEGADAVVVYRCQVTREVVAAVGERCKVVARQGVGVDNLNAQLLRDAHIYGFNVALRVIWW